MADETPAAPTKQTASTAALETPHRNQNALYCNPDQLIDNKYEPWAADFRHAFDWLGLPRRGTWRDKFYWAIYQFLSGPTRRQTIKDAPFMAILKPLTREFFFDDRSRRQLWFLNLCGVPIRQNMFQNALEVLVDV